jgi:hypothetical protein
MDERRAGWERDGFFRVDQFASLDVCAGMRERVVDIARRYANGERVSPAFLTPEQNLRAEVRAGEAEELVSKIFRLHRDPVFQEFATSAAITDVVAARVAGIAPRARAHSHPRSPS